MYHFTVENTRFNAPLTRHGKTKIASVKGYNLCMQIINPLNEILPTIQSFEFWCIRDKYMYLSHVSPFME